jgi:hypothetical protein
MEKPNLEGVDEKTFPMPVLGKHPLRFGITGVAHTLAEQKAFITNLDMDEDLKRFVLKRLDQVKTNAAEIHLHDVDRPGEQGGFDLHITVDAIKLGGGEEKVVRRQAVDS